MELPTVVIADNHPVIREGLKTILESAGFRVTGSLSTPEQMREHLAHHRPNLLILDFMLPDRKGVEIINGILPKDPPPYVVIFSTVVDPRLVRQAMRRGVRGYISKESVPSLLIDGIRRVLAGERYIDPVIQVTSETLETDPQGTSSQPLGTLSAREEEVFHWMIQGLTSSAIADRLRISARTIEKHRANIRQKLGCRNQTELIRIAIQMGLLSTSSGE